MWRTLIRAQYLLIVASATHIFASEQTDLIEEDLQSAEPRQRCSLEEHELDRRHLCVMSYGWQVCLVWPARKERLTRTTALLWACCGSPFSTRWQGEVQEACSANRSACCSA